MTYKIIVSKSAYEDIESIFEYIAYVLLMPDSAKRITGAILERIQSLSNMPCRYQIHLSFEDIRFCIVESYIVFYKVNEERKEVVVSRIMYGGRNISNQQIN